MSSEESIEFLIWANGDLKEKELVKKKEGQKIIALDGGISSLEKLGVIPDYLLGDFDSITEIEQKYWQDKGVQLIHTPDQNYTDLEKGISFADSKNAKEITIVNSLGARFDHSFASFIVLKKYYRNERPLRIKSREQFGEYCLSGSYKILGKKLSKLGLIPFDSCLVSSFGLEYELTHVRLELLKTESVGNYLKGSSAQIKIEKGSALIFYEGSLSRES